jgi:16S rRNA G966 N2-methylase RsmD
MKKRIINNIRRLVGTVKLENDLQIIKNDINDINKKINNELGEIRKAFVFNNSIIDCKWIKNKSFSPGYWACDYTCLYTLFRVLNDMRPKSILEFGLGQSSKLIHQYANFFNEVNAITCEHDSEWINFFTKNQNDYNINLLQMELEEVFYKDKPTLTYKNYLNKLRNEGEEGKFDFIFVDAPYGSNNFSRSQIIYLIKNNIKERFCIIMDDYNRKGEKETMQEVMDILNSEKKEFSHRIFIGEKEHILICSKDINFLTTI